MRKNLVALVGLACVTTTSAFGAIVLTNGSFEATGAALGAGLFEATRWTNNSSLAIQASSALAGFESTSAGGATGSRFLLEPVRVLPYQPGPAGGSLTKQPGIVIAHTHPNPWTSKWTSSSKQPITRPRPSARW